MSFRLRMTLPLPAKLILISSVAVSVALLSRIDWSLSLSKGMFGSALSAYIGAVLLSLLPYAAAWQLLRHAEGHPRAQLLSAIVVPVLSVVGYIYFWQSATTTGGWEILVIDTWQAVAISVLYLGLKVVRYVLSRAQA